MENNTELLDLLFRLEWLLRRRHMQFHRDRGPMGTPHRGQGRILALLALKPEMSQKELAAILDIRSQSLGELLAKLERQGYITRTASEADRRVMDVRLTDAGRAAAQQDQGLEPDPLFSCLTGEEQSTFASYLERLIRSLEDELGAEGPPPRGDGFGPPPGDPGFGRHGAFGRRGFGPGPDRR